MNFLTKLTARFFGPKEKIEKDLNGLPKMRDIPPMPKCKPPRKDTPDENPEGLGAVNVYITIHLPPVEGTAPIQECKL